MAEHRLKCLPVYYDAIVSGDKTFEVRRDDRGFQKGDIVILDKFDTQNGYYTVPGDRFKKVNTRRQIKWILTGGQFGIEPGYVVLALGEAP